TLLVWVLSVADVFAVDLGSRWPAPFEPFVAWLMAAMDPKMAVCHARFAYSVGTRWISLDVLLLPRCLLQGVLGRPAGMRRWRTSFGLPRRAQIPVGLAKRPSILSLFGTPFYRHSRV